MRTLVATAMLVLFVSLNAIDGIYCPDGWPIRPITLRAHQHPG